MSTSARSERFALTLGAAGDLGRLDRAYDAELLISALLGSVYAIAGTDRAQAVTEFATGLRRYLARRRSDDAALLRAVVEAVMPVSRRRAGRAGGPAWLAQLGTADPTGSYASADEYGDQVSYVATFTYPDPASGGPEHALLALVDHNLGFVTDLMITAPAAEVLTGLRAGPGLSEIDPARLRGEVERHLAHTDALDHPPDSESLATDRALAIARLRLLPAGRTEAVPVPSADDRDALLQRFLSAPEGRRLAARTGEATRPRGPAQAFGLDLIFRYAEGTSDRDPLRWSPAAVDLFLLDWVPRNALLDAEDAAALPVVLGAWVRWAGRVRGLSAPAVARTVAAIAELRARFAARSADGTHQSPAVRALAELLADGVDPADEAAVSRWLDAFNARPPGPAHPDRG